MPFDATELKRYPTNPGVYLMKNEADKILYIGKAKNLRNRLKQYFAPSGDGREMVPYLTAQVTQIDTIVVLSETEALLLEHNLIQKHRPKYNALLKDDKTFFSLMINQNHEWPMVRVVRNKGKPKKGELYFGPYVHARAARHTFELLHALFPLRQCSDQELARRERPCMLYEMKRCIAPCVGYCSKEEYDSYLKKMIDFLRGHDSAIVRELKKEMEEASERLEFEKANRLHQIICDIEQTLEKQKVEKAGRQDLDVLGIYREADRVVLVQLLFREGKLISSRDHLFSHNAQEDGSLVASFILQHYGKESYLPHELLLPIDLPEKESLATLIAENKNRTPRLHQPKKGDKRALLEMASKNAETKFKRIGKEQDRREQILLDLEEQLKLNNYPGRIACFDNSNISGSEPVSALITFLEGLPHKNGYRKFKIHQADASDDYGALEEAMTRYLKRAKEDPLHLPDLIVIDGGRGHLNVGIEVLSTLNITTIDLIAVAKEQGRHDRGMTAEQIFLPEQKEPILLKANSPLLFLLQQIRDEAHRFAITFQRQRRGKKSLASALDSLPGIGPVKKQRLLKHFGSLKRILAATDEELLALPGITKKDVATLRKMSN